MRLLLWLLMFSIFLFGETQPVTDKTDSSERFRITTEVQIGQLQQQIATLEVLIRQQQQEIGARHTAMQVDAEKINHYQKLLERQDQRINDLGFNIDLYAILVTAIAVLFAGIIVFFSFRYEKQVKAAAKEELKPFLEEIEKAKNEALEQIHVEHKAQLQQHEQEHQEQVANLEQMVAKAKTNPEYKEQIKTAGDKAGAKPTTERTYQDWFNLATDAYLQENYSDTVKYLEQAIQHSETDEQIANALVNKGVALGQQGDFKGAIAVFDEIVRRFENDASEVVRGVVAKAQELKQLLEGEAARVTPSEKTD